MEHLEQFVSEMQHAGGVNARRIDDFRRRRHTVAGLNTDLKLGAARARTALERASHGRYFATQVVDLHSDISVIVEGLDRLLTGRQIEIVCGIATGITNHQISRALRIKESTVNEHIRNIKRRLGLEDRVLIGIIGHRWVIRSLELE